MRLEIEQNVHSPGYAEDHVADVSSVPEVDASRLFKQGVSAAQGGERELARTLLCRVTETEPQNADAWLWLASISEYPEELLGFLNNVLEIEPDNIRAREWKIATKALLAKTFVQRGINAHSEGQTSFAMDCFESAIDHDNECEIAWVWKASLADTEEFRVTCLERVLAINPQNQDAKKALCSISGGQQQVKFDAARTAAVEGKRKKAETILNEILEGDPSSVEAWTLRSQVVMSFEEKLVSYRRIAELDPSNEFGASGLKWMADAIGSVRSANDRAESENVESVDAAATDSETNHPHSENILEFPYEPAVIADSFESEDHIPEPADDMPVEFETASNSSVNLDDQDSDPEYNAEPAATDLDSGPELGPEPVIEFVTDTEQIDTSDLDTSGIFDTANMSEDLFQPSSEAEYGRMEPSDANNGVHKVGSSSENCPFCGSGNDPQAFECSTCRAALTLSDIESVLVNPNVDRGSIQQAITQMEAEWNLREFDEKELTTLGIGHLNLRNYDRGFAYLQEASRLNPNNVILAGQVNAIAIRLDEIRRQIEDHEGMPTGKNILVVDDSATVRKLISSKLEKSGHIVVCAEDGVEAMAMMENMVPDLVLLDIAMPRMDGYSVCKLIRSNETTKDVPVVMISGKDGFFDKVRGRMAGTTGYITKPFGPETLMRALETYLLPDNELAVVGD